MTRISSYVLTKNSEKYLSEILRSLETISDEIIIVDSGSNDSTKNITNSFKKTKFYYNEFKSFKEQRLFAEKNSTYDIILFLDCDEIPDAEFINSIKELKINGLKHDAYRILREWNVLGKNIHCIYPITSPDHPIRLYNKKTTSFKNSQLVHERLSGYKSLGLIKGTVKHFTFETINELNDKLELYTDIAAQDLIIKKKKINIFKITFSPLGSFIKWYFIKKGFKDGFTGMYLGIYAYNYTRKKYKKAKHLLTKYKMH
tara:strand:+ start:96 stop:869 length:774 start_codon:yes stop_codon:yes gene_type:complete